MNEELAREILKDYICEYGGLYCLGAYLSWTKGCESATLDGRFTPDELEAIAWWMKNKGEIK